MNPAKKEIRFTIRLDLEMRDRLQELADLQDRKLSDFIRIELGKIIVPKIENNDIKN
jgi:predicted transcriptional regulator